MEEYHSQQRNAAILLYRHPCHRNSCGQCRSLSPATYREISLDSGAAGGGVYVEKDGGAQGGEDHREEQLQHELVGERTVHGKRPLKELNEPGGENGTVDRPGAEAPVEHYKAQHQKEHIDDGVEGRGGELGQQLSQQIPNVSILR